MRKELPENIDVAVYPGHWPYHNIPNCDTASVLESFDVTNTVGALASPMNAIFYKDPLEGYTELVDQLKQTKQQQRVKLAPIMNPALSYWEKDYAVYRHDSAVVSLRLIPGYHNYTLSDTCVQLFFERVQEDTIPIFITLRMQDARMRHWLDNSRDVGMPEINYLIDRFPKIRICLSNCRTDEMLKLWQNTGEKSQLYFDTSGLIGEEFYRNIEDHELGQRILYGSGRPYTTALCSLEPIHRSTLSCEIRERILIKNAQGFLRVAL
jgi:hypothetical protein